MMENRESNYTRIADLMLREAVSDNARSFSRLAPERELAEKYRCSRVTIRKALEVLEGRGCISRIERQGTFWVEPVEAAEAEPDRETASWHIAVVIFNFGFQHGLLQFMNGIQHAGGSGRSQLYSFWHLDTSAGDSADTYARLSEADGYIVAGDFRLSDLSWFIGTRNPVVVVGQAIDRAVASVYERPFSLIRIDTRRGWEMATEQLIESGYTRPAVLVASRHQGYADRHEGVLDALRRAGLPAANCRLIVADPETDRGEVPVSRLYHGVEQLFVGDGFDCLLTTVEPILIIVAAQKHGFAATDLFPIVAECNQKDLSPQFFGIDTISDDMESIGKQSIHTLFELLKGSSGYKVVNITPHLNRRRGASFRKTEK